jgi:hypothetical protein
MAARIASKAIATLLVVWLAGCGSGGGSGSSGQTPASPTLATVSGVVSSGFLNGAQVTVYCGSVSGTTMGTALTDSSGVFSVKLTAPCGGPILTQAASTSSTTMLSKLTGQNVSIGAGFTLRRYDTQTPGSGTTTLFVTPISDMVARTIDALAAASGSVTAAVVQQGITAATTALGISPTLLQVAPATLAQLPTASLAQQHLYVIGAALEALATPTSTAAQLAAALSSLETTLAAALGVAGTGSMTTVTVLAAGSSAITTALNNAIGIIPAAAIPAGVPPVVLVALTLDVTIIQISTASYTGITAAKSLITNLKNDFLSLWVAGGGFFNTQEATIRSDLAKANVAGKAVGRAMEAVVQGEALALYVANPSNATAVAAGSQADDSGNTYFTGNKNKCRVYTHIVNATPLTSYQTPAPGGVTPAVCLLARTDLPALSPDGSGNPGSYFEAIIVTPSTTSVNTTGANGNWSSWTSPLYNDGIDPFAVKDPLVAGNGVTGQSATVTGVFNTTNITGAGTANVSGNFTLDGGLATYDKTLDASGNPIPDVATVSLSFAGNVTGSTSASGVFTLSSITVSNLTGSVATGSLTSGCSYCGLSLTNGNFTYSPTSGGVAALTVTATTLNFQFVGSLGVKDDYTPANLLSSTPATQTLSGTLTGNVAFTGAVGTITGGVPASTPFFSGTVTLTNWTLTRTNLVGKPFVTRSISGGLSGTITDGSKVFKLNVTASDASTNGGGRTATAMMTFIDPSMLQATLSITETYPAFGPHSITGSIASGDTTVNLTSSTAGTVNSAASGGQIGSYSNGTFTFDDGTYLVI